MLFDILKKTIRDVSILLLIVGVLFSAAFLIFLGFQYFGALGGALAILLVTFVSFFFANLSDNYN